MKKFFYLLIALALSTGNAMAFENEPEEGLSWMGIFGMNISRLQNTDYSAKAGATLGIRADYMLPKAHGTYLTAGIDWSMKGGKASDNIFNLAEEPVGSSKYVLHYIEVPIRVGFRYNVLENLGIYGELGPYFAVGVGGSHGASIGLDGQEAREAEEELSFNAFKNYDDLTLSFQRWDAGIGFRIGAEYEQHYNVMIGAEWGLADIYRTSLRDRYFDQTGIALPKVHNFNFSITVGYRF
ncbi:MAG: outer membrane beta-barrel protein [Bacteroidaceae bacterium]|nr:outer membrane beta-barrel protein [Bacteroidaceae bacterium]